MLALVTSAAHALDSDLPLLLAELPEARVVTWDDRSVDWSAFGAVVIRSTWDYHAHLDPFLAWARSVAAVDRAVALVVAALPPTAYARVDVLPTDDGPVLLELEAVEPSLFLHLDPAVPARAAAVFRNLMP